MRRARILVADDEPIGVNLVGAILRRAGYEITSATDGEAALRRFREYVHDLVLLGIMLPKLDGFEVCARLREWSTVPIIMLTAVPDERDKARCFRLGANDYLVKPFSIDELVGKVQAALPPESS